MGWLFLILIVAATTGLWPVSRWVLRHDGDVVAMGFWVSLSATCVGAISMIVTGTPFWIPGLLGVGLAGGFAYSVGFCICIMVALKIGPAGPTVTINNMAMVFGVFYSVGILQPQMPNGLVIAGVLGICIALLMLGFARNQDTKAPGGLSPRWVRLVLLGGALSGLSFVCQTHAAFLYPKTTHLYVVATFGTSTVILLALMLRSPQRWRLRRERVGGICLGCMNGVVMSMILAAIAELGAEVALPVTVATPVLLILLLGRYVYKEHLPKLAYVACVVGAISLALLAWGKAS